MSLKLIFFLNLLMQNCISEKINRKTKNENDLDHAFSYMGHSFEFEEKDEEPCKEFFKIFLRYMPETQLDTCPGKSGEIKVNLPYKVRIIFLISSNKSKSLSHVKFHGGYYKSIYEGFSFSKELRVYEHNARINALSYLTWDDKDLDFDILVQKKSFFTSHPLQTTDIGSMINMTFEKESSETYEYKKTSVCNASTPYVVLKDTLSIVPFDGHTNIDPFYITVKVHNRFQEYTEKTSIVTMAGYTLIEKMSPIDRRVFFVLKSDKIEDVKKCDYAVKIHACNNLTVKYTVEFENNSCIFKSDALQPTMGYPCLLMVYLLDIKNGGMALHKFTAPYDYWKLYDIEKPEHRESPRQVVHSTLIAKIEKLSIVSSYFAKQYWSCFVVSILLPFSNNIKTIYSLE